MEKILIFLGQFSKIARIACLVLAIGLAAGLCIEWYKSYHPSIYVTLIICGAFHTFFSFANAYSTKIGFEHIMSTGFALITGVSVGFVLGANMKYGYWAIAMVMMPTLLALIAPILYSTKLKLDAWKDYVAFGFAIIGIFCFDALEQAPNCFNAYIALLMFVIALAVMYLPEKEKEPKKAEC